MKRTVTANVSGIVFHIEEDAYEKLDDYLQRIRSHISEEEGLQEIMEDVESRIAELFKESMNGREVVTEEDVDEMIKVLGRPEDFSDKEEEEGSEEEDAENEERDRSGTGKRIFRDPDDKLLGGVCSGISSYFGWDPLWLRLAFVLAVLLVGSGPLIYIVLWLIIPEARTRAEKLQMRGKPVDLDNLKRKVKEETEDLKDRFNQFGKEGEGAGFKARVREFFERTGELLKGILRILGILLQKLAGILLLILGISFTVAILNAFLGFGEFTFVHTPEGDISFDGLLQEHVDSPLRMAMAKIGFGLFMGVPAFLFFYLGTKALFDLKGNLGRYGLVLFAIWLLGIILCAFAGAYYVGMTP